MSYSENENRDARWSNETKSQVNEDEQGNGESRKRRAPDVRMSYPRKRAVTACQLCRMRKTKCDNQRPSCGTCLALDIHCNYHDRTSGDLSSFDPASLTILDRLNTAIQLLQDQAHLPALIESLIASQPSFLPLPVTESPTAHSSSTTHRVVLPSDAIYPTQLPQESSTTLEEALQGPGNCHNILDWPILEGRFSSVQLMVAYYDQDDHRQIREGPRPGSTRICEEDASKLVEYFLQHVHIKNPIFDPPKLNTMAKQVAEQGFRWDGISCLVLIICALANLATPFSIEKPGLAESSVDDAKDYPAAEAYYTAARKRLGLLDNSVLAVQCTFLIGVYQMYSMRPLKAWMSFSQACAIFQTYLHTRSHEETARATKRLEQSLYWSCLKSECEMRDEVDLAPSGLAKVNHPDVFPSPPGSIPEPESGGTFNKSPSLQPHVDVELQKSWYYYLSEIASRRLKNRISTILHGGSPLSWQLSSIPRLHRLAEELDSQVQRWAEHVPGFLSTMDENTTDELTSVLMARYLDLQELICRPFLYLIIHSEPHHQHSPTTLAYAERGLDLQIKLLRQFSVKHRHHGSWYCGRQRFTHSLMLIAAVRSRQISVPADWADYVQLAQNYLRYFEGEAPDLGAAREILVTLRECFASPQEGLE